MREDEFIIRVKESALKQLSTNSIPEDILSEITRGKYIRPRTIFNLALSLTISDIEKYIPLAASTEMVHLASLFHDDVIDNGSIRRGRPTVNARYGNLISILAGDYLFSAASQLVLENYSIDVSKTYSRSVSYMAIMELKQATLRWKREVSEEDYFDIIRGKTGALFSASFESVGIIANMNPQENLHLREAGLLFGEIFQVVDDLLDFRGTTTGKSRLKDLSEGDITLPAIVFMNNNPDFAQMVTEYFLSRGEKREILTEIERLLLSNQDFARVINDVISQKRESLISHLQNIKRFKLNLFISSIERIIERQY